jgi:hypothetical protein
MRHAQMAKALLSGLNYFIAKASKRLAGKGKIR